MEQAIIPYALRDLPVDAVEYDEDQPRGKLNALEALKNLKASVKLHGIQQPITVTEHEPGRFIIIDGHRRYLCAKQLNFSTVPCLVYPRLRSGELEVRRYEMQNIRRPWKPLERADALHTMMKKLGCSSKRELASAIGISEASVGGYLELRDQQTHLKMRLQEHGLNDSFQLEVVRLKPHLRKHAGFEADEIIDTLLQRISSGNIKSSKEIRIIKSAFIRIDIYGDILSTYLRDPDMRVKELEEQILTTGFSWDIQKVVAAMAKKRANGERLTDKEQDALRQVVQLSQELL